MKFGISWISKMLVAVMLMTGVYGWSALGNAQAADGTVGTYENLGTAIKRVVAVAGSPFKDASGRSFISGSVNGSPAQFAILDAITLEAVKVLEIPNTTSAVALLTGADGNVYIGTTGKGELYRYVPGADRLEYVGKPIASETHIYDLTNGPDGKIYGVTYPGGKLFEYDTDTGVFRDLGTPVPGEKYARQVLYDANRDLLIVGTGANCRLVEVNLQTGAVSPNLLSDNLSTEEYPNSIDLIGGKLFLQLNKTSTLIVLDPVTRTIEYQVAKASANTLASPDGDMAYFFAPADGYLYSYQINEKRLDKVVRLGGYNGWKSVSFVNADPAGGGSSHILSAWMGYTAALTYDQATGVIRSKNVDVPGQPIEIRSLGKGPDGNIYVSGTQGGTGIYNPNSGGMESRSSGISQAEGMTNLGSMMYFGIYPQARLTALDTSKPWAPKEVAKMPADSLQDRPFGMAASEEYGKVFMGSVPQYGQLGGAFAVYNPADASIQTYRNLVQDQSIITLVHKDGKIYGGTSIWGAYGAPSPTQTEGKLFVWDIASGKKELELVPVQGKEAVTSLIIGPDGNIWGFDEGWLFIFDPIMGQVVHQSEIIPVSYAGTVWSDAFMLVGKDANVYGTARGVFFRIDGKSKLVTILDSTSGYDNLTQDDYGHMYMRSAKEGKKHELWRYTDAAVTYPVGAEIRAEGTDLQRNESTQLHVERLRLSDGTFTRNVSGLTVHYVSSDPSVLSVVYGTANAVGVGTAEVRALIRWGAQEFESNPLSFHVRELPLAAITLTVDSTELNRNSTTNYQVTATASDGANANLSGAVIKTVSSNPSVVEVTYGRLSARNPGTAEVYAQVTMNGQTLQSSPVTVKVLTTLESLAILIDRLEASGHLPPWLIEELRKRLEQISHNPSTGQLKQENDQMDRILEILRKMSMDGKEGETAKGEFEKILNMLFGGKQHD